jgi:hypothetical protein
MKVPLISSRLTFRHRRYNHLDEEGIGFIARWIIIIVIIRGLIYPSHGLGFFVDNRVSIMRIRWFSAVGSPSTPSYLTAVLFAFLLLSGCRSVNFLYLPLTYYVSTQ